MLKGCNECPCHDFSRASIAWMMVVAAGNGPRTNVRVSSKLVNESDASTRKKRLLRSSQAISLDGKRCGKRAAVPKMDRRCALFA